MNLKHPFLLVVILAAFVAAGCSSSSSTTSATMSSPMKRIDANRDAYESWPIEVRMAILDGNIIEGMTREQVQMALGDPTEAGSRMGPNGSIEEIWVYRTGGSGGNVLSDIAQNVVLGSAVGGVGVSTRGVPMGGGGAAPVEVGQVVFVNGRVVKADDGP